MVYAIGVLLDGEWVWATEPTSNQRMVLLQMEGPLGDVDEDSVRVFIGTTLSRLNYALKLHNSGMMNASLSFKQVADGSVFDAKSIRDLEMEYGHGDHNTPYIFTLPTHVQEVCAWMDLKEKWKNTWGTGEPIPPAHCKGASTLQIDRLS